MTFALAWRVGDGLGTSRFFALGAMDNVVNESKSLKTPHCALELRRLFSSSFSSLTTLSMAPKAKNETRRAHHQPYKLTLVRDAGGGGAGGHLPLPSFGISVNPIRTKGADYARHITTVPPIILDDAAFLLNVS